MVVKEEMYNLRITLSQRKRLNKVLVFLESQEEVFGRRNKKLTLKDAIEMCIKNTETLIAGVN